MTLLPYKPQRIFSPYTKILIQKWILKLKFNENLQKSLLWPFSRANPSETFLLTQKFEYKNEFSLRLRKIIAESEKQTEAVAEKYMLQLRVMYLVRMQIPKANSIWIYNFAIP